MKKLINNAIFLFFTLPFGICVGLGCKRYRAKDIVHVIGWENFPIGEGNVILFANHQSLWEPIGLIGLFYPGYLYHPFRLGPWNMPDRKNYCGSWLSIFFQNRFIAVDRSDRAEALKAFYRAKKVLKAGGDIILFPESGRTCNGREFLYSPKGQGRIRKFTEGFGLLARAAHSTLVPVWVDGTYKVLPNIGRSISYRDLDFNQRVTVVIGKPRRFIKGETAGDITQWGQNQLLTLADQGGN